jgi:hypothetical protein
MDSRLTLKTTDTFLGLLNTSYHAAEKVYLLIEEDGMTRVEGLVKSISENVSDPFLVLQDDKKIFIKNIIAVNGIFLPEYGEC